MSEEQLKAFWEAIQSDPALQQKLQGVTDPASIVEIAKEAGFTDLLRSYRRLKRSFQMKIWITLLVGEDVVLGALAVILLIVIVPKRISKAGGNFEGASVNTTFLQIF